MTASAASGTTKVTASRIRLLATIGLLAVLSSCTPAYEPQWIHLARGADEPMRTGIAVAPEGFGFASDTDGLRATQTLVRSDWTRASSSEETTSVWEARQLPIAIGRPAPEREAYELEGHTFDSDTLNFGRTPGTFTVTAGRVRLTLAADAEPPPELHLSICATHQARTDEGWLVSGRRIGGEGFAVWPGESIEVRADVPPHSTLRFATTKESALLAAGLRDVEHTFRVFVDDAPIFEYRETGSLEAIEWHAVPLPAGGARGMRFRLEVEGPYCFTGFLDPIIGPTDIGTFGARPWTSENGRDDVVVFLADTFRADNMTAYGGTRDLTPNLDRFARTALTFTDVWSVSTHTLPTHSTLFSGVYPRQNGQVDYWNPLPDAVDTLAEILTGFGYRTVAITDGIMVSQTHGMSQGFAWFDERRLGLDSTVERVRAALAADDGRPLFLFVQSYATHAPFKIRPATRARLGDRLDAGETLDTFMGRIRSVPDTQRIERTAPGTEEALAGIRTLYHASVVDLDDGFGELLEEWNRSGVLEHGWLLVTSDHGEALGEHDRLFHAGVTFDEALRVPLILHGPRAIPGTTDVPTSLIDFAPTIADMAGVPPRANWIGRSLLDRREPGPLFAFQCRGASKQTTLAVVDGRKKLIGFEDTEEHRPGDWWAAFDLARDPSEEHDVLGRGVPWTTELAGRVDERLVEYLTPSLESERTRLTPDRIGEINDMGYAGSDE